MQDELLKDTEILKELQQIKRLLVILCIKEQPQKEKIKILSNVGFQPKEIADLIGTTAHTVSVILSNIKKEAKKKVQNDQQKA
jgi:predicted Rossmann fold nucleotide-binding protein DprA/Smf involved in DNA uptake